MPTTLTPLEVFRVQNGRRYRFRVISSLSFAGLAVIEIENHNLTVIASDSYDVHPATVDSIVINAGERYDFVLEANKDSGSFFLRVKLINHIEHYDIQQFAVLSYEPESVTNIELAFPNRKFPEYSEHLGQEIVSKRKMLLIRKLTQLYSNITPPIDFQFF
jgi:L-ascorbate oxidase